MSSSLFRDTIWNINVTNTITGVLCITAIREEGEDHTTLQYYSEEEICEYVELQ